MTLEYEIGGQHYLNKRRKIEDITI